MKRFVCFDIDDNGEEIEGTGCGIINHVIFDGYNFGDRLLECMMFKASLNENGDIVVDSVDEWDKSQYLVKLNKEYWMKRALDYAKKNDIATCPKCGNDIYAQAREV